MGDERERMVGCTKCGRSTRNYSAVCNGCSCAHDRQVVVADTDEWICELCGALMHPDDPERRLA